MGKVALEKQFFTPIIKSIKGEIMLKFDKSKFSVLAVIALVVGCAGPAYRPIIDTQGVDFNRYEADLRDCQSFSTQTADAAKSGAVGATAGAVLGSVLAGVTGDNRKSSAELGAITGAISGAASGETNQRNIIRRCLAGRGYRVLQ
jgi:hypothetical protein